MAAIDKVDAAERWMKKARWNYKVKKEKLGRGDTHFACLMRLVHFESKCEK